MPGDSGFPFAELGLPAREAKPRLSGTTMVLDKSMSLRELTDLVEVAGAYIDVVKFGWGTARVTPRDLLEAKIRLLREHDIKVCPGGTLMEVAWRQGRVDHVLGDALALGFDCVEVSDGSVRMSHDEKLDLIREARGRGLTVFSEVGKKSAFADQSLSFASRVSEIEAELGAGATKVIMEAREAGASGIFDASGEVIPEFVDQLHAQLDLSRIVFEAPRPDQQAWLIRHLGNGVNIGNVAPRDALNLETLRTGLRSDTFDCCPAGDIRVRIVNGIEGAREAARRGDLVICVDTLRASTTIVAALAAGIASVRTVSSPEECLGELTAGERLGQKLPGLDFDNSPLAFHQRRFDGQELVLTTTNGTRCIAAAEEGAAGILIGALVNARAVAQEAIARARGRTISVVMAGRRGSLASEDLVAASRIVDAMQGAKVVGDFQPLRSDDLESDLMMSGSGSHLSALGREDDVRFCAQLDIYDVVPILRDGRFVAADAR
ncbi:MAG: phosphosulfolactate synthase [Gammaproteobacteria bacterium]|nr:phosphosulfolactate synthase [Gammaproteobacteria bacterium]MCP5138080.1 phosphosulfolactate synthase [Gammaproteobacteria bacterium]